MPVKRRKAKRRTDPLAEAQLWDCWFTYRADFFHELRDAGFADYDEIEAAAPDAWARCGVVWAQRVHNPDERPLAECWASKQYGEPEQCR